MKKLIIILSLFSGIILNYSCVPDPAIDPGFEDMIQMSIYDYMADSTEGKYSNFLKILEAGGIDKTLSAYNPDGENYTLFLPSNEAVDRFISNSGRFNSINDLLNDKEYVNILSRYHVVNKGILSNDFPFGAFPEPTLSEDYLTVSFIVEPDTAYYKINNQAPVMLKDIEASNGYVHIINEVLIPITITTYGWLEQNSGYSIFKQAVDATGFKDKINFNLKDEEVSNMAVTLLVEHDSIFNKQNIFSFADLVNRISPNSSDYLDELNPLYNFVGYHVISGNYFLDDFEGESTNYSTFSDIPVGINGTGIDIIINKGKEVFDTIIANNDTTYIDYVGFYYDVSNIITQSGSVHLINQMMTQQSPSMADKTFEFGEEFYLSELMSEPGDYIIDDHDALSNITWTEGVDLYFIQLSEESETAWGDNYIQIDGDFVITYRIPKIVQGKYDVLLGAEAFNSENALVEVYIDGKKVGGLNDLSTGGTSDDPFIQIELGTIDFIKYEEHIVQIKSLIPGRFLWDYIRFELPQI